MHVPAARGKVIPDMASMSEDFPALWDPKTAMIGMSRSNCALREKMSRAANRAYPPTHPVARRRFTESSILRFSATYCGSERPTGTFVWSFPEVANISAVLSKSVPLSDESVPLSDDDMLQRK